MIRINSIKEVINHTDGLKVILFDLDDTLYGEKQYVKSGYHEVAKQLPMIENAENKLWDFFEQGKYAIDELLINEECYNEQLKNSLLDAYRNHVPNISLYPCVREMIQVLSERGIKIGIITDGRPEGQRAKIRVLELDELFDEVIITDELGGVEYRKPNSMAFEIMAERFKIHYKDMCYVGDNISKDFVAPELLGMKCMYFKNSDGLYLENET